MSKIESAAQELDETLYWFELLTDSGLVQPTKLADLSQEGHELLAIFTASARTAKDRAAERHKKGAE